MARLVFAKIMTLLVVASALGGCAGGNQAAMSFASVGGSSTVAFESVDGPPPQVSDRLVRAIDAEALSRNVAVVSRDASAAYRVRTYLSAQIRGRKTVIAWVWDVYDRNQERAVRLTGEEIAGRGGRDTWAVADDAMLRRIAQAGLSGFANATGGGTPVSPSPAPESRGPAVASAESRDVTLSYAAN